jgi:hypothetical protein
MRSGSVPVGDLFERCESGSELVGHERVDALRSRFFHVGNDVDEHNGARNAGREFSGEEHRREAAK